jgi:hypothetical protein
VGCRTLPAGVPRETPTPGDDSGIAGLDQVEEQLALDLPRAATPRSALSVGLCLAHMVTDKRAWLERLGVTPEWSMSGKPIELYLDNAAEFKSEALRRSSAR